MFSSAFLLQLPAPHQIIHGVHHRTAVVSLILSQLFRNPHQRTYNLAPQIPFQLLSVAGILEGEQDPGPPVYILLFVHIVDSVWQTRFLYAVLHEEFYCFQRTLPVFPVSRLFRRLQHIQAQQRLGPAEAVFQQILSPVFLPG